MIRLDKNVRKELISLYETRGVPLEGNIIKLILRDDDEAFNEYLDTCLEMDKDKRRKRLEITKRIQSQNTELVALNLENHTIMTELQETLNSVESSKSEIEDKNKELLEWKSQNEKMSEELRAAMEQSELARIKAENASKIAENDLDLLQRKTQYELINTIVRSALYIIVGVGIVTSVLYVIAIITDIETQNIGTTWSHMLGILLTNAFSIVGTIMGVKYASEKNE